MTADRSLGELLDLARTAARAGGAELASRFGGARAEGVRRKAIGDYASQADLAAERIIAAILSEAGEAYGFLGEETGERAGGGTLQWVVDPLDGTSNFIWGIPYFAVSIALCDPEGERLGVVYDPLREEMFTAVRGQGAQLDGRPLPRIEDKRPEDAIVSLSLPVRGQLRDIGREAFFRGLDEAANTSAGIRRLGSAALDLAYVGAGRLDGYFEDGLSYYDFAAGKLVAQEAGALVTSLAGARPTGGSLVAGSETVHTWLSKVVFAPE